MIKLNFFLNGNVLAHSTVESVPAIGSTVNLSINSQAAPNTFNPTPYVVVSHKNHFKHDVTTNVDPSFYELIEVDVELTATP